VVPNLYQFGENLHRDLWKNFFCGENSVRHRFCISTRIIQLFLKNLLRALRLLRHLVPCKDSVSLLRLHLATANAPSNKKVMCHCGRSRAISWFLQILKFQMHYLCSNSG